jgi:hypothetical protein
VFRVSDDDVIEDFDFQKVTDGMRSRVTLMSASLGVGSPLGWLCVKTTAAAQVMMANRNTLIG